jgi:hypothetical protein
MALKPGKVVSVLTNVVGYVLCLWHVWCTTHGRRTCSPTSQSTQALQFYLAPWKSTFLSSVPLSNLNIEKARSTLGSSDGFRRIRSLFSSNRRKPTRDSIKLGSSMDRLSSESEMATTRYKRPIDKLHPLIAVSAGRPSVELRTDIGPETHDISATRASPGGFEMRSLDAEGQERITVTKTFEVR